MTWMRDGVVALVAHDAGGAEIITSYANHAGFQGVAAAAGPARHIFQRKLQSWRIAELSEAIAVADWVLTGTSWQSDLELTAIRIAKECGKPVAAFLDHWVNFRERFQRAGVASLPDEIWVADTYAEAIAREVFRDIPVVMKGNPYIDDMMNELELVEHRGGTQTGTGTLLYVTEPIRAHALSQHGDERYWGYTEDDALRYFFDRRGAARLADQPVILRPHPAESPGKYDWAVIEYAPWIAVSHGRTLVQDIAASETVVGCESMAMVVALVAGKRVMSCIPPGGRACSLPHRKIEKLRELV